jgi:hypothetical protein
MNKHAKPTMADIQAKLAEMTPEASDAINASVAAAALAAKQKREAEAEAMFAKRDADAAKVRDKRQPPAKVVPLAPRAAKRGRFKLVHWFDIEPSTGEEWLIRGIIPRQGVGTLFGASQAFKSFVAIDFSWHLAEGRMWAGREVEQAPVVYFAAEGEAGCRKRLNGVRKANGLINRSPLHLIGDALNLGTDSKDAEELIASVEELGVKPGLIVIDTAAASMGTGEENTTGMQMLLNNCQRLSTHFRCFILAIHHIGHGEDAKRRERGWSGASGNTDTRVCVERSEEMGTVMEVMKVKDEVTGEKFGIQMERVTLGEDKYGYPITTLVVKSAEQVDAVAKPKSKGGRPPAQQTLLMEVMTQALIEEARRSYQIPDGPSVPIVTEEAVCARYLMRNAERPLPDEDQKAFEKRRRKAFRARLNSALNSKLLIAGTLNGETILWTPKDATK